MFVESQPADTRVHESAIRIARRCRFTVQACLREEEWADADREFYVIAREELERFGKQVKPGTAKMAPG
jgi:hypothetical protein